MKKNLLFVFTLCFAFVLPACGGGGGGSSKSGYYENEVNGRMLGFATDGYIYSDDKYVYVLNGEVYNFESVVFVDDPDAGSFVDDDSYDRTPTVWKISGGFGYFGSEGVYSTSGETMVMTVNAAAGKTGTLQLELDGMIRRMPVKVVEQEPI